MAGARARTQEGSGIGLALVSDLVRLHGGAIGARSRLGRGASSRSGSRSAHRHLDAGRMRPWRGWHRAPPGRSLRRGGDALAPGERAACALGRAGASPSCPASCWPTTTRTCATTWSGLLEGRFEVEAVRTGTEALAAVRRAPARPGADRRDDARPRRLRAGGGHPRGSELEDTPVLMLSARAGEEAQERGTRGRRRRLPGQAVLRRGSSWRASTPTSPGGRFGGSSGSTRGSWPRCSRTRRWPSRCSAGPSWSTSSPTPATGRWSAGRDVVGKPLLTALPELQGQGIPRAPPGSAARREALTSTRRSGWCSSAARRRTGGVASSTWSTSR